MTAPADIKSFMNLSGRMVIGDLAGEPLKLNVKPGDWTVTYERNDDHDIVEVAAACDKLRLVDGAFQVDEHLTMEHEDVDLASGVLFCSDGKLGYSFPKSFKVPERRLNDRIVAKYGKPDDEGKSESDRFYESCYHLCVDAMSEMPLCESTPYGIVSWIGKGKVGFTLLKDAMRDVVGIEIRA